MALLALAGCADRPSTAPPTVASAVPDLHTPHTEAPLAIQVHRGPSNPPPRDPREDPPLPHLDITQEPLGQVAERLVTGSGISIILSPDAAKTVVSARLRDTTVRRALPSLCRAHGLHLIDDGGGLLRIVTVKEWKGDLSLPHDDELLVMHLRYVPAEVVARTIFRLMPEHVAVAQGDTGRDSYGHVLHQASEDDRLPSQDYDKQRLAPPPAPMADPFGMGGAGAGAGMGAHDPLGNPGAGAGAEAGPGASPGPATGTTAAEETASLPVGGKTRLAVVPRSNTLLVRGGEPRVLEQAVTIAQALDSTTRQVLVEIRILELDVREGLHSTMSLLAGNGAGDRSVGLKDFPGTSSSPQPGASSMVTQGLALSSMNGRLSTMLSIGEAERRVRTIGAPVLLLADHAPGSLAIGEERPIVIGYSPGSIQATNSDAPVTIPPSPTIKMVRVGMLLTLSPRVNADGTVTLKVSASLSTLRERSAVIPLVAADGSVTETAVDTVETSELDTVGLAVDGGAVVLGGLIRERHLLEGSGLPWFRRWPVIGWLFDNRAAETRRTELLLVMTPRLIAAPDDGTDISQQATKTLQGLKPPVLPPADETPAKEFWQGPAQGSATDAP